MPKINLLIHGIGNQSASWHEEATAGLHTLYTPFYWEDIRDAVQQSNVSIIRQPWRALARVVPAYDAVLDVLTAPETLSLAMARLSDQVEAYAISGYDVVIHAHSLGSVLAYLYILQCQPVGVKALYTYGSPIGRWPVSKKLKECFDLKRFSPLPSLDIPWINVTNKKDYVTSWLGNGKIKEAYANLVSCPVGHDLNSYLRFIENFPFPLP
jgi:hypothetical protein